MRTKSLAFILLALFALSVPASAAPAPVPSSTDAIPCGTRSQLHLTYTPRAGQVGVYVDFDASGGGTVWAVVPPNQAGQAITNDGVTRHYSVLVPVRADGPNPIPVQVLGMSDATPCTTGLTVTNITLSWVVPQRLQK
jgi:hypothetical protein